MTAASPAALDALAAADAHYVPPAQPGPFDRLARRFIHDPRDVPFIAFLVTASLVIFPCAAALFYLRTFAWWLSALYLVGLFLTFVDRFILLLHNTSHRPLFLPQYRLWNLYVPWVLGPFCGETPETYYAHHVGMHHPENNLPADLSSTMRYQRDRFGHFLHYFFTFLFRGIVDLSRYLSAHKRGALKRRMLRGELSFWLLCLLLSFWSVQATLTVFVLPVLIVRFLMMCGNWGQHAFIDPAAPGNCHRNSLTCVDSRYNRRCFNDGYHIGHHLKANMHWTEMPDEWLRNRRIYAEEGAIVLRNTDFFVVWALLMTRQFPTLARLYVHVGDGPRPTDAEIIALLRSRLRPIV